MAGVIIILSTYNGAKYLEEQMESLLKQTYPVRIYIHDDGSSDETMDIIRRYDGYQHNGTSVVICENSGINLRYPLCFLDTLLKSEKADYYAFCDQDDFWFPEKTETGVHCLENRDQSKPLLFYSAVNYCDEDLNIKRQSHFTENQTGENERIDPVKLIYGGGVLGMSVLFNHTMREYLEAAVKDCEWKTKDELIKKIAAACGEVWYTEKPLANYRRHRNAVTAKTNTVSSVKKIVSVVKKSVQNDALLRKDEQIYGFLLSHYAENMLPQQKEIAESFKNRSRMRRVFLPARYRSKLTDEIGLRLLILLGQR